MIGPTKRRHTYTDNVSSLVAENMLKQNFVATKPNEKWVTDITQIQIGESRLYLSAIKDLLNNEIVA